MAGQYSLDDLLLAILAALRVKNNLLAEEFGRDDELPALYADAYDTLGVPRDPILSAED